MNLSLLATQNTEGDKESCFSVEEVKVLRESHGHFLSTYFLFLCDCDN